MRQSSAWEVDTSAVFYETQSFIISSSLESGTGIQPEHSHNVLIMLIVWVIIYTHYITLLRWLNIADWYGELIQRVFSCEMNMKLLIGKLRGKRQLIRPRRSRRNEDNTKTEITEAWGCELDRTVRGVSPALHLFFHLNKIRTFLGRPVIRSPVHHSIEWDVKIITNC
jgi:hypothetical protein